MKNKINAVEFKARTAQRNQFSAVDTLGSFDFSTAIICLNSLKTADLEHFIPNWRTGNAEPLTGAEFSVVAKVQPLAVHEYTHFVDSTSTLWGLRHLTLMNDAYSSAKNDEAGFHKAKTFFDHVRSIRLPSYYTAEYKHVQATTPWISRITVGRIFDKSGGLSKRPILFSQFFNAENELIVRSPVSAVSILEASAMAQELMAHSGLLSRTEREFRLVEERDFARRHIDFLHSRELTEYSVSVHILANKLGCKDALVAFRMCAALTGIALNFPLELFEKLSDACPVEAILNVPQDSGKVIRDGLRTYDLGTIYYLLCNALPADVLESETHFRKGIDVAVRALGITTDELISSAQAEAQRLADAMGASPIKSIRTLAMAGHENFKRMEFFRSEVNLAALNLPPALLGDDAVVQLFKGEGNALEDFVLEDCYFELDDGMSWVDRFSEACL